MIIQHKRNMWIRAYQHTNSYKIFVIFTG